MNIRGRDEQLRVALERRRAVNFRGSGNVKPVRLVYRKFGDGCQLIAFHPPNTGPNYFVVRVDSSWQLSDTGQGASLFSDHIGEVVEAIEAQFGAGWYEGDPPAKSRDNGRPLRPSEIICACGWFPLRWPAGLEPPTNVAVAANLGEYPAP